MLSPRASGHDLVSVSNAQGDNNGGGFAAPISNSMTTITATNGEEKLPEVSAKSLAEPEKCDNRIEGNLSNLNKDAEKEASKALSAPSATTTNTTASTNSVSPEVMASAPLLRGVCSIEKGFVHWSGEWGMNEAAFSAEGVTSKFEFKSQISIAKAAAVKASEKRRSLVTSSHPSCFGIELEKSATLPSYEPKEISPVFYGYFPKNPSVSLDTQAPLDANTHLPFAAKYDGYFHIQVPSGPPQKIPEKGLRLEFHRDSNDCARFFAKGEGSNRFGPFGLSGHYHISTKTLELYKVYKPKPVSTKSRVATRKRVGGRPKSTVSKSVPKTSEAASCSGGVKTVHAGTKPDRVKKEQANLTTSIPPPTSATFLPTTSIKLPGSAATGGDVELGAATPKDEGFTPRGRSERKRVVPAHLREDEAPSKFGKKKLGDHLKRCLELLKQLTKSPWSYPFLEPVDPVALKIPDYFTVIKKPMDFATIKAKLEVAGYPSPEDFAADVRLVFQNAMTYNRSDHPVHQWAKNLMCLFDSKYPAVLTKYQKKNERNAAKTKRNAEEATSKIKIPRDKLSVPKTKGGKGVKGHQAHLPSGKRKTSSKQSEIEMMKAQIEQMKAQIQMMHSGTPVPTTIAHPKRLIREDVDEVEDNRPMTFEEKRELSLNINRLPDGKLSRVVQIISERIPLSRNQDPNEEIEIDINSFDTPTLRMLQRYVRQCLTSKRKRPSTRAKRPESQLELAKKVEKTTQERIQSVQRQLAALEKSESVLSENGHQTKKPRSEEPLPAMVVPAASVSDSSTDSDSSSDSDTDSDSNSDSSDEVIKAAEKVPSRF